MPSHAMFTGLYPPAHGVRDNGTAALPEDVVTLARAADRRRLHHPRVRLRGRAEPPLWPRCRIRQLRRRPVGRGRAADVHDSRAAGAADGRSLAGVVRRSGRRPPNRRPFFTWVHFFDPHQPLEAAPEDRGRRGLTLRRGNHRGRSRGRPRDRRAAQRRRARRHHRASSPPIMARASANMAKRRTRSSSTTRPSACR